MCRDLLGFTVSGMTDYTAPASRAGSHGRIMSCDSICRQQPGLRCLVHLLRFYSSTLTREDSGLQAGYLRNAFGVA